ncbi:hypothetical protein [Bradyrhizobium sp. CCGUVB23]|uniref:hypothetical protein n=1 Tax=Bradyrhizobium sp. CCGUVB23 TaxID=2949630 RepID=UPI0020B1E05A|nr:hypothetical protein [Bradyrhizobium sp. CCGUVB23]MCP3460597.1 hypothetical protein [Bradyrhizobium sp. CCGUVB23]
MALPSRAQTFAFENCRDLLDKLEREIDRYQKVDGRDEDEPEALLALVDQLKDSAFNAAVTAWQLCDWVFNDMTPEQRQKLKISSLGDLQTHARDNCRALYLCRHAATASKHWEVSHKPDPDVQVEVWHDETGWTIHFVDGANSQSAYVVFECTRAFWNEFIRGHGIGKGQDEL